MTHITSQQEETASAQTEKKDCELPFPEEQQQPGEMSRRQALLKIGQLAAYVAPATLLLVTSEQSMALSVTPPGPGP